MDASRVPFVENGEDFLLLTNIDGTAALANLAEGYRARLTWQPEHFPCLSLWMSFRGRKMAPWNGRHLALGMEPVCSPFGLGPGTARANNPLAAAGTPTAYPFKAAHAVRHEIPHRGGSPLMAPLRVVGIDFDHMHMGDLLREVHEHADAEIAGICDADPKRMQSAIANFSIPADQRLHRRRGLPQGDKARPRGAVRGAGGTCKIRRADRALRPAHRGRKALRDIGGRSAPDDCAR